MEEEIEVEEKDEDEDVEEEENTAHVPVSEDFDTSTELAGPAVFVSLVMSAFHIRASY